MNTQLSQNTVTIYQTIILILPFIALLLAIIATVLSLRRFRGAAIPLWILLSWILPFVGAIITIIAANRSNPENDAKHIP
jgi:uncharacterized membrane protein YhaH (DUF805 family)